MKMKRTILRDPRNRKLQKRPRYEANTKIFETRGAKNFELEISFEREGLSLTRK